MKNYLCLLVAMVLAWTSLAGQDTMSIDRHDDRSYERTYKKRYTKPVKTRFGILDVGISTVYSKETYTLENGIDPFEMRLWPSNNFTLHFAQQRVSLYRGYFNLVYSIAWDYNKYYFDNPVVLLEDTPQVTFEYLPDVNFKKNRLAYTYLTFPLMINFKSKPDRSLRSFHLSFGGYASVLLMANFKTKTGEGKLKVKDNYALSPWRFGLRGEIGFGPLIFYGQWGLTDLFEEDKNGGYSVTPYTVGLVLWPF